LLYTLGLESLEMALTPCQVEYYRQRLIAHRVELTWDRVRVAANRSTTDLLTTGGAPSRVVLYRERPPSISFAGSLTGFLRCFFPTTAAFAITRSSSGRAFRSVAIVSLRPRRSMPITSALSATHRFSTHGRSMNLECARPAARACAGSTVRPASGSTKARSAV
jgi:hypothetical protein